MKVKEAGTDREAKVHVHIEGHLNELQEYGEFIDPVDRAICCYVPVEEGDVIRVNGKFHGTTSAIVHDTYIDGILRKTNNWGGKSVKQQKSRSFDCDKALIQLNDDDSDEIKTLDTQMKITAVTGHTFEKGEGPERIGTIEVRLYVLRVMGEEHTLENVASYQDDNKEKDGEDKEKGETHPKMATYKSIVPDFMVTFEENEQELDAKMVTRFANRLTAKRPGQAPWAIFRFYYRSEGSILAGEIGGITHNPKKRKNSKVHDLELDPVPELCAVATPTKTEDGETTRNSTPSRAPTPMLRSSSSLLPQRSIEGNDDRERISNQDDMVAEKTKPTATSKGSQGSMAADQMNAPAVNQDAQARDASVAIVEPQEVDIGGVTEVEAAKLPEEPAISASLGAPNLLPPSRPVRARSSMAPPTLLSQPDPTTLKRPAPISTDTQSSEAKRQKVSYLTELRNDLVELKTQRTLTQKKLAEIDQLLAPYKEAVKKEERRLKIALEEEVEALENECEALKNATELLVELRKEVRGE